MNLVNRAFRGIVWAQVGKIAETALAFLLSIVVIRRLGPEDYGEYGLILGILGLGTLLTSLGFRQTMGKHIPRLLSENEADAARFLYRWTLGSRFAITLAVILMFWPLIGVFATVFHLPDLSTYRWPLTMLFLSQNAYLIIVAFYNATLRMKHIFAINLVLWSSSLLLTLFLFHVNGVSVAATLWASALANLLSFLLGFVLSRDWLTKGKSSSVDTRPLWRFGITIWFTDFANFGLGTETDVLFMGYFLSSQAEIGFYRAAVMPVRRLLGLLFGAWSGLTMPILSEARASQGHTGVRKAWETYVKLLVVLAFPVLIFLGVFAQPILTLLYSNEYASSGKLLQLLVLFSLFGFAVGHGLSTELLQTINKEGLALRLRLLAGLLNIVLNLLLIPQIGAAGALIGTGLSGFLISILETRAVARRYSLVYPWAFLLKTLFASVTAAAVAHLIYDEGWLNLIASGILFTVTFLSLLFLLKPLSEQEKASLALIHPQMKTLMRLLSRRRSDDTRGI